MWNFDNQTDFDAKEWAELVMIADQMDTPTRMVLCEFSNLLDSRGEAQNKPKLLAKTTGIAVKDVRKMLTSAKDLGWLEQIDIDGRKGYRAVIPV